MLQWERRRPRRRLTTSYSKKNRAAASSLPPSARPPPHGAKESERTDLPSKAKSQDVEPPSFEYTQSSKEGAKNDAPPNEQRP